MARMSWQEDLQRLDDDLAEGRISAQEYRRRSEDLIAAASGPPVTQTQPHRATASPTEPMRKSTGETTGESTGEHDQPVGARQQPQGPGDPPSQRPEPESRPTAPPTAAPPTALPPPGRNIGDAVPTSPQRTGRRRSRRRIPTRRRTRAVRTLRNLFIAGVIVVALAAAGVAFALFPNPAVSGSAAIAGGHPSPGVTGRVPPFPDDMVPRLDHLPGRRVSRESVISIEKLPIKGICSRGRMRALREAGADRVIYLSTIVHHQAFSVTVIANPSQTEAEATAADVERTQRTLGLARSDNLSLPRGVSVLVRPADAGDRIRGVYVSGPWTVVIGAFSASGGGLATAFRDVAQATTNALPPT